MQPRIPMILLQSPEARLPDISLVMPAYNVAETIELSIASAKRTLDTLQTNYEIIVIDDGSNDDTYQRVRSVGDSTVKLIRNPTNQGKGFSFKRGVEQASGGYLILCDADLEINTDALASYMEALRHHDLVISSKRLPTSTYNAPLMRKFLSVSFNTIVNIMMGLRCSDTQTGLKAFRTEGIKKIMRFVTVKRYAFDVEVLVVAKLLNLRTIEMPAEVNLGRRFSMRSVMYMTIDILGIFYRYRIIRWYQENLSNVRPNYNAIVRI